jgi:hypothetical protein
MPLSTFIFYCGNITLLTAYAILARMSARPGGVAFFSLAALLHLDMAIHTITRIPFFDNGTSRITWDFSIIVFAKMTSVVVALIGVRSDAHRRRTVSPG